MKRIFFIGCVSFFACLPLSAQQQSFIEALALAEKNYLVNNDSLLFYAQTAIDIGIENEYPKTSEAYKHKAAALFYQARYQEGIDVVRKGLEWITIFDQQNVTTQADLYNRQGGNYILLGYYKLGLEYLLKARTIYQDVNDQAKLITILNNIGVIWLKLNDYENALLTYNELALYSTSEPNILVPLNYNFANIYYDLGQYKKALHYAEESLNVLPENDPRASQIFYMLGNIQSGLGDLQLANKSYLTSISLYTKQSNELNTVQPKLGLAKLLIKQDSLESAFKEATESLQIALTHESLPDRIEALFVLSMIAENQGNLSDALTIYKTYTHLSDSLKSTSVNQEIASMIAENTYDQEKQALLFTQQEQRLRAESQIQRQRIIIAGTLVIIVLVFSILLIQRNKAKERQVANETLIKKNKEIEEKARKLDEANSIKNRLFSIISHDLRNPLSSMQGVIQLIEMNAASKEELDRILPYLTSKFDNTSIMLGNLLEWSMSQMDGYKVEAENFDLTELVHNRFEIVRSRTDEKELSVILPSKPVYTFADQNMIGIVVLNLLSNAIKFTGLHGKIKVTITDTLDEIIIAISDTGKGIPTEKLPYVLNDQFESTQGTKGEKGTGLGLIICKEFIQKNNGEIWIQSEVDNGTTVSFSLPVAVREEVALKKEKV